MDLTETDIKGTIFFETEMEEDIETEKKARRSSILKPQKPRNPFATLDFTEVNPDNTLVKATRRVSFASSNFVKPFAADPEKNTIWDNTYEEEIDHTDSTKSSCDQTQGTKVDILNMSTVYSDTLEKVNNNEKIANLCPSFIEYDVTEKVQIINENIVNTVESLVSFAKKQRSKSSHVINEIMDSSCSSKNLTQETMEFTACLTDKENVNPLINDPCIIIATQNCLKSSNKTTYFEENLPYTLLEKENNYDVKENAFEVKNVILTSKENERYSISKKNSNIERYGKVPFTDKIDVTKNAYHHESVNKSLDNIEEKTCKIETSFNKESRKTIIFSEAEDSLDFTLMDGTKLNTKETSCGKEVIQELSSPREAKVIFNKSDNTEFTTALPVKILSNDIQNYNILPQVIPLQQEAAVFSDTEVNACEKISTLPNNNILYSEPMKMKIKTEELAPISELPLKLQGLDNTLNTDHILTPAISFHMGLSTMSPCIEDTQQLIHATFSKPETLKVLSNDKTTESRFSFVEKDTFILKSKVSRSAFNDSATENDSGPTSRKLMKFNNSNFTDECAKPLENVAIETSSGELDVKFITLSNEGQENNKSCFIEDITPLALVPEEFDNSNLETQVTNKNEFGTKLAENIKFTQENDFSKDTSTDCANYSMRSEMILRNIEKYLLPYKPMKRESDLCAKLYKEIIQNCSIINNCLLKKKTELINLQEKHKQDKERFASSINKITASTEEDLFSALELNRPKSLEERIYEIAKSNKKNWELKKVENDYYYFCTLFGTMPFKVHLHPELGKVYSVETYSNLSDISPPISQYLFNFLQQKLKEDNLFSVLGTNIDILTLLDYICMSMDEIVNFHVEYLSLVDKYGHSHNFRMNPDFSVAFDILNVQSILFWIITIKMPKIGLASIVKEDIAAVHKVGKKVNEEHIRTIAENTPKGPKFLRNFIENVDEYVKRISKRMKK